MIWLLLNAWWLVAALVALLALGAVLSGIGGPALLALAKRVPAPVYGALLAVIAMSVGSSWLVGVGEARCEAKREAAEAKADVKAAGVVKTSKERAAKARQDITKESTDAVAQVRTEVRYLPRSCPELPDSVRESVQRQVEAARDGVPEPARGGNP